ncbi:hypothetical protein [Alkalimarinus coralli]|uniref:hypothetical protein n=1 Tax=Alkalimarinus coralli TaxID=2935863 RepID=UPI00202B377A|nr:hypothetical protein [Alkalimarinus coralli]
MAAFDAPHAKDIANQELQKFTFEPLTYLLIFCTGSLCLTPDRFRGKISLFFEKHSPKVRATYEGCAGSVLGWGIGSGAATVLKNGMAMLPVVVVVCCIFLILAMGPLWANESVGGLATKYKEFMVAERKGKLALQLCGVGLIIIASWGLVQWWHNG